MKKKLGLGSGVAICVGLIVATSCLVSLGTDKVGSLFKIRETLHFNFDFYKKKTKDILLAYHLQN